MSSPQTLSPVGKAQTVATVHCRRCGAGVARAPRADEGQGSAPVVNPDPSRAEQIEITIERGTTLNLPLAPTRARRARATTILTATERRGHNRSAAASPGWLLT
jgi:hypothetical protein